MKWEIEVFRTITYARQINMNCHLGGNHLISLTTETSLSIYDTVTSQAVANLFEVPHSQTV
jgi:hypothetical protein